RQQQLQRPVRIELCDLLEMHQLLLSPHVRDLPRAQTLATLFLELLGGFRKDRVESLLRIARATSRHEAFDPQRDHLRIRPTVPPGTSGGFASERAGFVVPAQRDETARLEDAD